MMVGAPCERWAVDLTGPHVNSNGYRYMFTAIDPFSKFGICVPIRNKEATTVANAMVNHIFLKWGLCHEILSDLGPEFMGAVVEELLHILAVTHLKTSGYRPQTNGGCEVWHRTLNTMLAKVVAETQKDWPDWVDYVTFCYNATEHSATGFSPFFVFTGRQPLWTVDLVLPQTAASGKTVPEHTAEIVHRLEATSKLVREHLRVAAQGASKWYNHKSKPRRFAVGDRVRVYYPRRVKGRSVKWQSFFSIDGRVERRINDATYLVRADRWRGSKVVHVDKIKPLLTFEPV